MGVVAKPSHSFDPSIPRPSACARKSINRKPCQWCQTHRYKCNMKLPYSQEQCERCKAKGIPCCKGNTKEKKKAPRTPVTEFQGQEALGAPMLGSTGLAHRIAGPVQGPGFAPTPGDACVQDFYSHAPHIPSLNHHIHAQNMGEPPPQIVDHLLSQYQAPINHFVNHVPMVNTNPQYYQNVPMNVVPPIYPARSTPNLSSLRTDGYFAGAEMHERLEDVVSPISGTSPFDATYPHPF